MHTDSSFLRIHKYPLLDSTNNKIKELANDGAPHGTVVIAEQQSAGRGRLGRSFFSPLGCGIYLSVLVRPEAIGISSDDTILLTTAASVAVTRAVSGQLHKELQIKWVNDLYYREKKVCGILTEGVAHPQRQTIDAIIIGIGVNYRTPEDGFPEKLNGIAGALLDPGEIAASKDELAEAIALQVFAVLSEIKTRDFLREYKKRSLTLGRSIRVFFKGISGDHPDTANGDFRMAQALDIAEDGGLVVRYEDGTIQTLTTGEISIRPADDRL